MRALAHVLRAPALLPPSVSFLSSLAPAEIAEIEKSGRAVFAPTQRRPERRPEEAARASPRLPTLQHESCGTVLTPLDRPAKTRARKPSVHTDARRQRDLARRKAQGSGNACGARAGASDRPQASSRPCARMITHHRRVHLLSPPMTACSVEDLCTWTCDNACGARVGAPARAQSSSRLLRARAARV